MTGQGGSYLAEQVLSKGYEVHGIIRRASTFSTETNRYLYQILNIIGVRLCCITAYRQFNKPYQITLPDQTG